MQAYTNVSTHIHFERSVGGFAQSICAFVFVVFVVAAMVSTRDCMFIRSFARPRGSGKQDRYA